MLHGLRVSRGVTQWARQTSEFEPDIVGMEGPSVKEGTTVAPSQPEKSRMGIGRPIAAPSQIPPQCITRPIASQVPASSSNKPLLTPNHLPNLGTKMTLLTFLSTKDDERHSHEQQIISKEFTNILSSDPNFHDIDGTCPWNLVQEKDMRTFPNIDPNTTVEEWLGTLKMGSSRVRFETCWYKK